MTSTDRPSLTRARILAAAVDLVDTYGIEALSMRRLGTELGVEAMSLYNHVENKAALLDGLLDHVLAEIPLPDPALPWAVQLRDLARAFRAAGHRHPGILPLFGNRAIRSAEGFAPLERAYGILREVGLDPDDALDATIATAAFVLGLVQTELGGLREVAAGDTIDFSAVDLDAHPYLVEMGAAFADRDGDREFELGLDLIIAGIERRLNGGRRSTEPAP